MRMGRVGGQPAPSPRGGGPSRTVRSEPSARCRGELPGAPPFLAAFIPAAKSWDGPGGLPEPEVQERSLKEERCKGRPQGRGGGSQLRGVNREGAGKCSRHRDWRLGRLGQVGGVKEWGRWAGAL